MIDFDSDLADPEFDETLLDAPVAAEPRIRRQTLIGFALAAALMSGAVATAFFVIYPEWADAKAVAAHANELERVAKVEKPLAQRKVASLKQGLASYDSILHSMSLMIPDSAQIAEQLRALASVSRAEGVSIARIAPTPPVTDSVFTRREFQVELVGPYHAVGRVLTDVASLDRLLIPRALTLVPNERMTALEKPGVSGRPMLLTASLHLVTFTVPTAAERANYAAQLAKAPKKASPGARAAVGSADKAEAKK